MFFNKLFQRADPQNSPARRSYEKIVAQARHPVFYLEGGIEDTVDGRFDMIVLHAVLLFTRLNEEADEGAKTHSQEVFDEMFKDMDRSLREMGVGDLSVGKKVKKMAQIFYGRARAYNEAMDAFSDTPADLETVVARNLFAGREEQDRSAKISRYMMESRETLRGCALEELCAGELAFSDPQKVIGAAA